jgi:hypothetical protein
VAPVGIFYSAEIMVLFAAWAMREERYFTQGGQLLYSSTYVFRTKCLAFDRIEIYTFVMALQPTRYGYRCHFALVTYCQHYMNWMWNRQVQPDYVISLISLRYVCRSIQRWCDGCKNGLNGDAFAASRLHVYIGRKCPCRGIYMEGRLQRNSLWLAYAKDTSIMSILY